MGVIKLVSLWRDTFEGVLLVPKGPSWYLPSFLPFFPSLLLFFLFSFCPFFPLSFPPVLPFLHFFLPSSHLPIFLPSFLPYVYRAPSFGVL